MSKCKICRTEFTKRSMTHKTCSVECAEELVKREKVAKQRKESRAKRKPKKTLSSVVTKADTLTSQYIRRKYADHEGNVSCVTCGKVLHWKDAHCAHYIERAAKMTRWLEENLKPACPSCNVYRKEFHKREYTLVIIDLYGREFIDELKQMAAKVLTPSKVRELAEEAIAYYEQRLKELP